jgi:hypothetical protein
VKAERQLQGDVPGNIPTVELLDARSASLDGDGLRDWARARAAASGGARVARSYRYPLALVGWHTEPIGVDVERVEPYDEAFAESICTPSERSLARPRSAEELASLWCSKEALAKALGDARRYDPRRLESPAQWPGGEAGPWRARALEAPDGYIAWVCWRVRAT